MAVHTIGWNGLDTDRKPSSTVWGKCPIEGLKNGVVNGVWLDDNFSSFNKTPPTTEGNWGGQQNYAVFSSTGGFITAPALSAATASGIPVGGITIGSDDDNEGVGIRGLSQGFAFNRAVQNLWFEVCLKKSSIANTILELFVGFIENVALTAVIPITAIAATLSDNNMVGFYSTESAGSTANTTYKANGVSAVTVGSAEVTFVADTFTKLGMRLTQSGDKDGSFILSFYQDGVRLSSSKQMPSSGNGTDFPNDVSMSPVVAVRNAAGSSPGTVTIAWWRAAQLYTPLN